MSENKSYSRWNYDYDYDQEPEVSEEEMIEARVRQAYERGYHQGYRQGMNDRASHRSAKTGRNPQAPVTYYAPAPQSRQNTQQRPEKEDAGSGVSAFLITVALFLIIAAILLISPLGDKLVSFFAETDFNAWTREASYFFSSFVI